MRGSRKGDPGEAEMTSETVDYGTLCDYMTGEELRPATKAELDASLSAAEEDGGRGVFADDEGRALYVVGGE